MPGFILWFTGLSGSGKSTLTSMVAAELRRRGVHVETLDGDDVRKHLSKGLGFSREDRDANIRRIGFVAKLVARSGGCAIAAAISPYREIRDEIRRSYDRFCEVYTECPIGVLAERDPKGLCKKALAGEIKNFTGVDDPYEAPDAPEVHLHTDGEPPEASVSKILARLEELGYIAPERGVRPAARQKSALLLAPHGGDLVDRIRRNDLAVAAADRAQAAPALDLGPSDAAHFWNIVLGVYSPVKGFLGSRDYLKVVNEGRLESGLPWTLPLVLELPPDQRASVERAGEVTLRIGGRNVGLLTVTDVFPRKGSEASLCVGGDVICFDTTGAPSAPSPAECRAELDALHCERVVALQTGDLPTRGLEYVLRSALEFADCAIVQVSATSPQGVPLDVRMDCWRRVLSTYFPAKRTLLTTTSLDGADLLHPAIVAQNFGASRLLVAAGAGGLLRTPPLASLVAELPIDVVPYAEPVHSARIGGQVTRHTVPDDGAPLDSFRPEVAEALQNTTGGLSRP